MKKFELNRKDIKALQRILKFELTEKDIEALRHILKYNENIESIRKENNQYIVTTYIKRK